MHEDRLPSGAYRRQRVFRPMSAAAPKLKECDIQRQIVDYLRHKGWFVAITSTPAMTAATKGLPDLIAVRGARTIWCEVKGPRGKQSDNQREFQRQLHLQSGEYLLARSLDDVIGYLG